MDLEKFMRRAAKTYKKVDTDKLIRNAKRTAEDLAEEFLPEDVKQSRTFREAKSFTDEVLGDGDPNSSQGKTRNKFAANVRETLNEAKKVTDDIIDSSFDDAELEDVEVLGEDEFLINLEDDAAPANQLVGDVLQAAKKASQEFVQHRKQAGRADDPMQVLKDAGKVADSAIREVLEKDDEIVRELRRGVGKVANRFTQNEQVGEIIRRGSDAVMKDEFVDSLIKEAEELQRRNEKPKES